MNNNALYAFTMNFTRFHGFKGVLPLSALLLALSVTRRADQASGAAMYPNVGIASMNTGSRDFRPRRTVPNWLEGVDLLPPMVGSQAILCFPVYLRTVLWWCPPVDGLQRDPGRNPGVYLQGHSPWPGLARTHAMGRHRLRWFKEIFFWSQWCYLSLKICVL